MTSLETGGNAPPSIHVEGLPPEEHGALVALAKIFDAGGPQCITVELATRLWGNADAGDFSPSTAWFLRLTAGEQAVLQETFLLELSTIVGKPAPSLERDAHTWLEALPTYVAGLQGREAARLRAFASELREYVIPRLECDSAVARRDAATRADNVTDTHRAAWELGDATCRAMKELDGVL